MHAGMVRARNQALLFIATVLAVSWSFEAFLIANGGVGAFGPSWIVVLMCIPGIVSVALRLVLRAGFADAGLQPGKARFHAMAIALPLLLALLVALSADAFDLRRFAPVSWREFAGLAPVLVSVLGLGLVGAFGEELGWRGFLLPKLLAGGVRHPHLACSVVWAAWHLPLIAFGGFYRTGDAWSMAVVYGIGIVAMGFVFGELRVRSGSVWVATTIHAAHNFIFQFAVPVLLLTVPGERSGWWNLAAGDTGLCIAALYGIAYFVIRDVSRRRAGRTSNTYD